MRAERLTPLSWHGIHAPQGSRHVPTQTYTPRSHFYVIISTLDKGKLLHAFMDSTPSSLLLALRVFISMHAFLTAVSRMND